MFDEAISLLSIWASMNTWFTPTFLFLFLNLMIGTILITSKFSSTKSNHDTVHLSQQQQQQQQQQPQSQLSKAPSVLQRIKSINFYSYYSQNSLSVSDSYPEVKPEPELKKVPAQVKPKTRVQTQAQTKPPVQTQTRTQTQTQTQTWAEVQFQTQTRIQTQTQTRAPAIEEDATDDDEGPTLDEIYNRIKGISTPHHNRQNSDTNPMGGVIPMKLPAKMKKSASDKSAFNHFQQENAVTTTATATVTVTATAVTAATAAIKGGEVDARADDFINRFKKQLQLQRIESIVRYKDMITRGSAQ